MEKFHCLGIRKLSLPLSKLSKPSPPEVILVP